MLRCSCNTPGLGWHVRQALWQSRLYSSSNACYSTVRHCGTYVLWLRHCCMHLSSVDSRAAAPLRTEWAALLAHEAGHHDGRELGHAMLLDEIVHAAIIRKFVAPDV